MPHLIVKLHSGTSEPQKARLTNAITKAVAETFGYGEETGLGRNREHRSERVGIQGVQARHHWQGRHHLQEARLPRAELERYSRERSAATTSEKAADDWRRLG